jgi:hypothetical protein
VNRKVLALNFALLALAGTLVWLLRANWTATQSRERAVLQKKVPPKTVLAPPAPPPVKPVTPADYVDVASKMLFSKDRNPTVVVEAPPVKPEPPMPALPSYHGQMAIGEPVIFLSTGAAGQQRSYHSGDTVGDFKLVSFDHDQIDLEWHGKDVQRKLAELKPKETAPPPAAKTTAAASPASRSSSSSPTAAQNASSSKPTVAALGGPDAAADKSVTSLSGPSTTPLSDEKSSDDPLFGPARPDGSRGCVASDTSPSGTVHSGYRKIQTMTLFGQVCNWEQVK